MHLLRGRHLGDCDHEVCEVVLVADMVGGAGAAFPLPGWACCVAVTWLTATTRCVRLHWLVLEWLSGVALLLDGLLVQGSFPLPRRCPPLPLRCARCTLLPSCPATHPGFPRGVPSGVRGLLWSLRHSNGDSFTVWSASASIRSGRGDAISYHQSSGASTVCPRPSSTGGHSGT